MLFYQKLLRKHTRVFLMVEEVTAGVVFFFVQGSLFCMLREMFLYPRNQNRKAGLYRSHCTVGVMGRSWSESLRRELGPQRTDCEKLATHDQYQVYMSPSTIHV